MSSTKAAWSEIRRRITNAYYDCRNQGLTMETAADRAAASVAVYLAVERDVLIEVVSGHPRWTIVDECKLCPDTTPYEEHIAPFIRARLADANQS